MMPGQTPLPVETEIKREENNNHKEDKRDHRENREDRGNYKKRRDDR